MDRLNVLWWLELEVEKVAASPNPGLDVRPSHDVRPFAALVSETCRDHRFWRLKFKEAKVKIHPIRNNIRYRFLAIFQFDEKLGKSK